MSQYLIKRGICHLAICLVFILAMTPFTAAVPAEAAKPLTISIGSVENPGIGEIITLPIQVDEAGRIGTFNLNITYDRTRLEFAGWDGTGSIFGSRFNLVTVKSTVDDVNMAGSDPVLGFVNTAIMNFAEDETYADVSGSALLGSILFKTLDTGTTVVSLNDRSSLATFQNDQAAPLARVLQSGTVHGKPVTSGGGGGGGGSVPVLQPEAHIDIHIRPPQEELREKFLQEDELGEAPLQEMEEGQPPAEEIMVIFPELQGHWAEAPIMFLYREEALSGYPDGSMRADRTITRAEFAVILVKAYGLAPQAGKVFPDTSGHWARDGIATAYAHGIIQGYHDLAFGPDDLVTREQMAVMIAMAQELQAADDEMVFADRHRISGWARYHVAAAARAGIISGYPDGTFNPQGHATRAEAATIIVRALDL